MKIILRVRELRKTHNLTQEELARQLNISRQSLISLEQGRWLPSLPLAIQLAEFFNTSLEGVIFPVNHFPANQPKIIESNQTNQEAKEAIMSRDLSPWSPFRELRELRDEMDRLPGGMMTAFPAINVRQDDKNIYIEAHMPGFTEEQIDVDVADDYVTISGNTEADKQDEDKRAGYMRREYQQQSFSRTIGLPTPVVGDKAQAKLKHGVLEVVLPKHEAEKPKTRRLKPTA